MGETYKKRKKKKRKKGTFPSVNVPSIQRLNLGIWTRRGKRKTHIWWMSPRLWNIFVVIPVDLWLKLNRKIVDFSSSSSFSSLAFTFPSFPFYFLLYIQTYFFFLKLFKFEKRKNYSDTYLDKIFREIRKFLIPLAFLLTF